MKTHITRNCLSSKHQVITNWWRCLSAILFMSTCFTAEVSAQNKLWDKTFGGDTEDRLYSMQQTSDGGYILGGTSRSSISGDKTQVTRGNVDYWVVKLKPDGSKAWDKTFGGNGKDELTSVQQTSDGGYILGGYSGSDASGDKSEPNKGTYDENFNGTTDYWVVKLNADGTKAWDRTIGGDSYDQLESTIQAKDGSYILGGTSRSGISGDKTQANRDNSNLSYNRGDYWVVKLNSNGSIAWDKTFGGSSIENLNVVQQTSDGSYILGGFSRSGISGDKTGANQGDGDYWVIKISAAGAKLWDRTVGGNKDDRLTDLKVTKDGSFILGGISNSDISGSKTQANAGVNDYWVVKMNANGNKVWDKTFGTDKNETLTSLQQTSDDGYIIGGYQYLGYNEDKPQYIGGDANFWVLKLQANGTKAWEKTIGGDGFDELQAIQQIQDGNYVLAGSSDSNISGDKTANSKGGNDYWVVKLSDKGNQPVSFNVVSDKTLGGNKPDNLAAMVPMPDGGYLLGGSSASDVSGEKSQANKGKQDYWIVKTDKAGNKIWDKTFGGSGIDVLTALVATPDGGYLLGGHSASPVSGDKTQGSRGEADYWLVKINASGTRVWDKTFGGNLADQLSALLVTPDGGYLLGGTSVSGASGDKSQASKDTQPEYYNRGDYWVIKINASGTKLWDKTYGGSKADRMAALVAAPNGDYLLGGSSASGISGDKSQANRAVEDYWVIRINSTGTKVWDKTFGGSKDTHVQDGCNPSESDCTAYFGSSVLSALVTTPDGGFLLGGSSNAAAGNEKSEGNLSKEEFGEDRHLRDYWVVKITGSGTKVWENTYGGVNTYYDTEIAFINFSGDSELRSIAPTSDGNYLLAGSSDSEMGRDKSENGRRENNETLKRDDYWVLKINGTTGAKLWDKTIGGFSNDFLSVALAGPNGNYILGGSSESGTGGEKTEASRDEGEYPEYPYQKNDYWLVNLQVDDTPSIAAWDKRYGGLGTDAFSVVIPTADGGYLSGGYTNSGVSGDKTQSSRGLNDYWVVKSDKNGTKLWEKRFGGTGEDYLNTLIQTQDGGYLLAGSSLSGAGGDKSQASRGDRDYWIVKISSTGVKQWDKRYGSSGSDEVNRVLQLSTGEYLLAGTSNSPAGGDKSQSSQGGQDYWVIKISGTGSKVWDKRFGGSLNDILEGLAPTLNGGFILGGRSTSGLSGDKTQASRGGSDYWLVRITGTGQKVWDKRFGGSGADDLMVVGSTGTSTGNFFLAGHSTSGISGDKSESSRGGKDFWMLKINGNGEKIFDKRFGGSQDEGLRSIVLTSDGGYLLAGRSESGVSGDKSQASRGGNDYWLVKTSSTGVLQWDQRFGGSGNDELRAAFQTSDGGYLLGGRSNSGVSGDRTQPSQGGMDYWLVKVAPVTGAMVATREASITEEAITQVKEMQVQAYPNPFSERATISFSLPATQQASVKVYDGQGNEVATLFNGEAKANQKYEVEWNASNKPTGLYFLQLQTPAKKHQQKLLLSK